MRCHSSAHAHGVVQKSCVVLMFSVHAHKRMHIWCLIGLSVMLRLSAAAEPLVPTWAHIMLDAAMCRTSGMTGLWVRLLS